MSFDGETYEPVDIPPFTSRYIGTIGFGGGNGAFLVMYGAYEGQGYYVRLAAEPQNISRFFGTRVMSRGFRLSALRNASTGDWYVFSVTDGLPKLIKLFTNGTDSIAGATDLTQLLFTTGERRAVFYPGEYPGTLHSRVTTESGAEEWWEFTDKGFDISETLRVVSANINNYPAEIRRAALTQMDFDGHGADAVFELSNDGNTWISADPYKLIIFPDPVGRKLLWRATVEPDGNPFKSPFLGQLRLDYYVKFF